MLTTHVNKKYKNMLTCAALQCPFYNLYNIYSNYLIINVSYNILSFILKSLDPTVCAMCMKP